MTLTQAQPLTDAELMALPRDGRKWEQVNGELKEVPTGYQHDIIGITIATLLHIAARGIGYVAGSQAGFRMSGGNLRSPDVSFMRKARLGSAPPAKGLQDGAPDLCVEIISPSEDASEMADKVNEYFQSGAQLVWHIFPDVQTVTVWTAPTQFATLNADDTLSGGELLPGFSCRVADLFVLD